MDVLNQKTPPEWVIVGLGNPGQEHVEDRHNVGFWSLDFLARRYGTTFSEKRQHVLIGEADICGHPVILAKPRTYMNLSGYALEYLRQRFNLAGQRTLVVVDDMDLPTGKLRLRAEGGSGGHHGLDSIINELGSEVFARLRIGIGRPDADTIRHVLGPFSFSERKAINDALESSIDVVEECVLNGIEYAMNSYN